VRARRAGQLPVRARRGGADSRQWHRAVDTRDVGRERRDLPDVRGRGARVLAPAFGGVLRMTRFDLFPRRASRLAAFAAALTAMAAASAFASDWVALPSGVSSSAARKLDPRLMMALSVPREESLLRALSARVPMMGASMDEIRFPVVVLSSLTDAELADL